jgi:hypothetical protein
MLGSASFRDASPAPLGMNTNIDLLFELLRDAARAGTGVQNDEGGCDW